MLSPIITRCKFLNTPLKKEVKKEKEKVIV